MHIYRFKDEEGNVIYIGKSVALVSRLKRHFSNSGNLTLDECYEVYSIEAAEVSNRIDMDILELLLINELSPKLNTTSVYEEKTTLTIPYELVWEVQYLRKGILSLLDKRVTLNERKRLEDQWIVPTIQKFVLFKDSYELQTRYKEFLDENELILTPAQLSTLSYLLDNSKEVLGVSAISKEAISVDLGVSRSTIIRACNRLELLGIIKQEILFRPLGGNSGCAIYFLPKDFDELIDVV